MKRSLVCLSASTAMAFAAAGCGNGHTPSSPASSPASSPGAAAAAGAASSSGGIRKISVATTKLGQVMVDGSGRTVYLFEADTGKQSICYRACAEAWPPVITTGSLLSGTGASAALLGTTTRTDGMIQVSYGGHPLYTFIGDKKAGDVNGQGLNQFGAKWYVLAPSGKRIDTGQAAARPSTNYRD